MDGQIEPLTLLPCHGCGQTPLVRQIGPETRPAFPVQYFGVWQVVCPSHWTSKACYDQAYSPVRVDAVHLWNITMTMHEGCKNG